MDKNEALRTFTTGENFHLQHYLGAHQDEVDDGVGGVGRSRSRDPLGWRWIMYVFFLTCTGWPIG